MTHLLVTNDFPPKVGGIQAYLWELWRRLDPDSFAVLTASSHPDAEAFDRQQADRGVRIERVTSPGAGARRPSWSAASARRPDRIGADLVVLDPVFPLGLIGPRLGLPYAVMLHGAEVAIPGRLPGQPPAGGPRAAPQRPGRVGRRLPGGRRQRAPCAGGGMPPVVEIPPGVDLDRFRPLSPASASRPAPISGCRPTARWWSA